MQNKKYKIKNFPKADGGFTILELIIYVAVFAVISAVFVDLALTLNVGWTKSWSESETQENLRFAMENIAQSVRSATAITTPAAGGSGSAMTLVVSGQNVQYFLSGTTLKKQTGTDPAENITTDKVKVTYLHFTTLQNAAISNSAVQATSSQFAMTVEYNASGPQFQYVQSATSTERIRN